MIELASGMDTDDIIALIFGLGCDPAQLCPASGITLTDVRGELARRLGGRALRDALALVDASEANERRWRAR